MGRHTACVNLAVIILTRRASGLGTSSVNTTDTVGFVKEDNQRDTISLLLSCFATLGLCVYSAVHLNVPQKNSWRYSALLKELQWCVLGLFAPELIIYTAWRQLASARQLRHEVGIAMRKGGGKRTSSEKTVPVLEGDTHVNTWTIAHGFYGGMGGFAIDLEQIDDRYRPLFGVAKRLTLTAKGVVLLAHCGHAPEISIDDIKDKNKADGLAKLLVCIQAGWMIVQVISRTATGLPSTLLEVHTVAHVFCAIIMYILWWHKPRQVESPTLLNGDSLLPLAVYMFLASRMSGEVPPGSLGRFRMATPEMKTMAYFENQVGSHASTGTQLSILPDDTANGHFGPRPTSRDQAPTSPVPDSEIKSEQKRLAAEAVMRYTFLRSRFTKPPNEAAAPSYPAYTIPYATELVQPHSLDWPNAGLLRRTQSLVMGMVLWGASVVYGAIHVAAWAYFFPTALEQLFWRLSSIWVTFCAAFWLLTNFLAYVFPFIDTVWVAYNERRLGWLGTGVITGLCILCGVSYVASRAFLVVEAFVSIREVPQGVYKTPAWSQVFPHL